MHHIIDAHRPTILFLHDSLGCITLWRDFPMQLAHETHCNVLIYDRQGYGQSPDFSYASRSIDYMEQEADMLQQLIEYWGLGRVILFGHSDGASIALIAAAKYPQHIIALITEGAHIFVEDITLEGIHQAIDLYRETDLKLKLEKYHGRKTEAMFWAWAATWTQENFKSWNIVHFLKSIQCPVLVIQGENDEYGSIAQVEGIAENCGGETTTLLIPHVKHSPHKEVPDLVRTKTKQFIQKLLL